MVESDVAESWPPAWRPGRRATVAVVVGALAAVLFSLLVFEVSTITTDVAVYRGAIQALLNGQDLYGFEIRSRGLVLPFTYPPFAVLVLMPAALAPETVVVWGWVTLQCAMLLLTVWLVFRRTPQNARRGTLEGRLLLVLGFLLMLASDPVMSDITLGQVSLGIVVLVLVDFLVLPARWRGVLTGLAAAIKLTPIVFVGYLLVTRQWRQAGNAVVAALVATAVGFAVLPTQSVRYWTQLLWDTGRVGDTEAQRNKSLLGVLYHYGVAGGLGRLAWLVLVAAAVVAVLWSARRQHLRGGELGAVISTGLLAGLISPIAWPHHLIWLPLAGLYLVYLGRPGPLVAGIGVLATCLTWSPLLSYETSDQVWVNILGDVSVLVAVAVAVVGLPSASRARAGRDAGVGGEETPTLPSR